MGRGPHHHPAVPEQRPRVHGDGQPPPQGRGTLLSETSCSHSWDTPGADSAPPQCTPPHRGQRICQRGLGACTRGAITPTRTLSPQPRRRGHSPSAKDNGGDRAEMDRRAQERRLVRVKAAHLQAEVRRP